jgi:hypothetical protein
MNSSLRLRKGVAVGRRTERRSPCRHENHPQATGISVVDERIKRDIEAACKYRPFCLEHRLAHIAVGNATFKGNGTLSLFSNRPVGALYPSPLQFGSISVGSTKTLSTTLYNSGGAPLVISAVTVSGEYLQTHTCGSTLAVGSSCKVSCNLQADRNRPAQRTANHKGQCHDQAPDR